MEKRYHIRRLPKDVQEKIEQLHEAGHTYHEISNKLATLGVKVSYSTIWRHISKRKKIAKELRRSREVAESVVKHLGTQTVGQQQKLLIELFHSAMLDLFLPARLDGTEGEVQAHAVKDSPKELATLATALHTLARVQQMTLAKTEEEGSAKKTGKKASSTKGLSPDTVAQIMKTAFGVRS